MKKTQRHVIPPAVRREVIDRWGNDCWLDLPGCTGVATEDDHIIPYRHGGKDTVGNIRRACRHCNAARGDRILSGYGAVIHAVIGPPTAGKSTYARQHAAPGDVIVDFDMLASAMMVSPAEHPTDPAIISAATAAWTGVYRRMTRTPEITGVWVIKCLPRSAPHPYLLREWVQLGYRIHVIDPGAEAVFDRLERDRRIASARTTARQWYAMHVTQPYVDALTARRAQQLVKLDLIADRKRRSSW